MYKLIDRKTSLQFFSFFLLFSTFFLQGKGTYDESLFKALEYREIGPFRGGRSAAVSAVPGDPFTYYMGATGGGVWKTTNGGQTWENISDKFFGGSIGAVAVSEWDPNVIYVGGGEVTVRGNVSHGNGVWKSTDAGKTWKHMGLKDSRRIPRIRIHPKNPDLVYAAVLGHLFGPNKERGVYRSKDGGKSWENILFVNDEVGACDLTFDPTNPRILYASTWRIKRTPYSLESGGEGSDLWKSTNGGDTWEKITKNEGLPEGTIGIIGVTVSPANPDRVWAMIEAQEGGLFRSDDGGKKWKKVNSDNNLRQRAWYYTRVYADPKNEDVVYVLNVGFFRSKDGGKSFSRIRTPHSDHHDLWIAPEDPNRMVIADDGGGQVTYNYGKNWSTYHNQPTAQFYRVDVDNRFPYHVYGGQQDNSTVAIPHRTTGGGIAESDWYAVGGGESGHIAPNPVDPNIVYAGSYDGFLTRYNHTTGERRNITVWPDMPMGWGAKDLKYRFQWNFPIEISPHDPNTLYVAANVLFKSTDEGLSWQVISPDLTRDDKSKQNKSGGPITKDDTSVEYYCTIFVVTPSPREKGVIWTGSDDGLIHVTKDEGNSWENVTPRNMPEWGMVNSIDVSPHNPAAAYIAVTRYKQDDFKPYIFKTTNYGKSWKLITNGIPKDAFVRVVREDPARRGLLYAGTETGMYCSFDDGKNWQAFQLNLPVTPITDLVVKENDLVVATQGRSFWILDDLTPLHQLSDEVAKSTRHLYKPRDTYRLNAFTWGSNPTAGKNPPNGVMVHYYFNEKIEDDTVKLAFFDSAGELIREFTSKPEKSSKDKKVKSEKGMNRFVWDMRYEDAKKVPKAVMWGGTHIGPKAVPGKYSVRLTVGNQNQSQNFLILKDPRISTTAAEFKEQFDFLLTIRDKTTEINEKIIKIRSIKKQVNDLTGRLKSAEVSNSDIDKASKDLVKKLTDVEKELIQTKSKSNQDPLNYPVKLDNKIAALVRVVSSMEARPTHQAYAVYEDLTEQVARQYEKLEEIFTDDLEAFNDLVKESEIPAIIVK